MHKVLVITLSLAFLGLTFDTEVTTARLISFISVTSHKFADFEEILETKCLFKFLVELELSTRNPYGLIEFLLEFVDFLNGLLKTLGIASHTYVLPHDVAKFLMKNVYRNCTLHCEEVVDTLLNGLFSLCELRTVDIGLRLCELLGEVISDSDRKNEVTIGQSLHEGRSAKTVSTVVREVSLTDGVKTRDGSFEIVVYPDTTHSVVDSRVNHHRLLPR